MSEEKSFFKYIPLFIGLILCIIGIGGGYYLYSTTSNKQQESKDLSVEIKEKGNFAGILFGKNKYELTYTEMPQDSVEILSNFEQSENNWQAGEGFLDRRIFIDGESSYAIVSKDRAPALLTFSFPEGKDFSKVKFIEFYLNITDVQILESATVKIGDENLTNYYIYSFTNLRNDWNVLQAPMDQIAKISNDDQFNLASIKKLQFEIISRPNKSVIANFDHLKLISDSKYLSDWQAINPRVIGLAKKNNQVYFEMKQDMYYQATLKEVTGYDDFVYEAKVSPQTRGSAGLFFRGSYKTSQGYYFMIGGKDSNYWYLKRNEQTGWKDVVKGELLNISFDTSRDYWMRVITSGDEIKLYFSADGKEFTQLAEVNDDTYLSGGVGLAAFDGYAYFNDIKVSK